MDKDSAEYFMTKMTQEEFEERVKDHKIENFTFNHIQPERSKREDLTTMSPLPKDLEKRLVDQWKKELLS